MILNLILLLLVSITSGVHGDARSAIANVRSVNITGDIIFTEVDGGLQVSGIITHLEPGKYGFHVHELGNIATCIDTGAHYNPDDTNHGGRNHTVRHVGDLGNIVVNDTGIAVLDFVDSVIALRGRNNILGRAVVIHEEEDDLGLGGDEGSLSTGNAGGRAACATIGILSPAGPWNAATTVIPSLTVLFLLVLLCITQIFQTIY
ncbi:superoxide dismutase [Cu-Zn]-like [Galleria mellonella]|uniref:Superoxide dismutase [Cu-Zn] n=1 Tax=Galleria mellonella TaxID=7137 RepID=A0A6J1WZ32_GALME|nr:superoxide dismutase [Cu-Zn]-like [Galleria mellonella]